MIVLLVLVDTLQKNKIIPQEPMQKHEIDIERPGGKKCIYMCVDFHVVASEQS